MSNAIEKVVSSHMADKKKEADADDKKPESNLPSDTISVARDVDAALGKLKYAYDKLKERIRKEASLEGEVEDLMEKEVKHIVKPY